jgi:antitoxin PrlF
MHYSQCMKSFLQWLGKSTLTDRFQTTIPTFVRQELGLGKRDLIEFFKADDGSILLRKAAPTSHSEEFSPELGAWLEFIARDHNQRPTTLKPFTTEMRDAAYSLFGDQEIDLAAELPAES